MGRAYQDELHELSRTAESIPAESVRALSAAVEVCSGDDLIVVASGGASIAAQWLGVLHMRFFGRAVRCLTPLQYAAIDRPLEAITWLISAGGTHADIMHAAHAALESGAHRTVALIGRDGSRLAQLLGEHAASRVVSLKHPAGVDGFLTTNGLWSMVLALWHAYNELSTRKSDVRGVAADSLQWAKSSELSTDSSDNIVVIHDAWTALGATDFQTRCVEASLANIWCADFRNFGHGRHYWLHDRGSQTELIALAGSAAADLASATLSELPSDVRVQRVQIPFESEACAIASLAWSMHRVAPMGRARSRDPGRPGVPTFGERLYEGRFPWPARSPPSAGASLAIDRKIGATRAQGLSAETRRRWLAAYDRFLAGLQITVRAAVFDFDGTLVETDRRFDPIEPDIANLLRRLLNFGVPIGVATGRGDSVYKRLTEVIPTELHRHVVVGYHNGSTVRTLATPVNDLDKQPTAAEIEQVAHVLTGSLVDTGLAHLRARSAQCTLTPVAGLRLDRLWRHCNEALTHAMPGVPLKVLLSSHSIDITTAATSKLHVVRALEELAQCAPEEVLRVGDRGAWPGNDYEILRAPLGFSVDECSLDPESCWNLASGYHSGTRAVLELFAEAAPNDRRDGFILRQRE